MRVTWQAHVFCGRCVRNSSPIHRTQQAQLGMLYTLMFEASICSSKSFVTANFSTRIYGFTVNQSYVPGKIASPVRPSETVRASISITRQALICKIGSDCKRRGQCSM